MSGWKVLGWSAIAAYGALMFLRLVAHHTWTTETLLQRCEEREREARKKRQSPPDEEPVAGVLRARLD